MRFIVRIREAEVMPPLFGVAWEDWRTREATCLPLPLNLVAGVARSLYLAARYVRPIAADPRAAYRQGWRERVDRDQVVAELRRDVDEAAELLREIAHAETRTPEPGSLVDRADNWLWLKSMREQREGRAP